jgi:hypothetical protein
VDVLQVDYTGRNALFYCRHTSVDRLTQLGLDVNSSSAAFSYQRASRWSLSKEATPLGDSCLYYRSPKMGGEDSDGLKIKSLIMHPSFEPRNEDVESILRLVLSRGVIEPLEWLRSIAASEEEYLEMLAHNLPACFYISGSLEAVRYFVTLKPQIRDLDSLLERELTRLVNRARESPIYFADAKDVLNVLRDAGKGHLASIVDSARKQYTAEGE